MERTGRRFNDRRTLARPLTLGYGRSSVPIVFLANDGFWPILLKKSAVDQRTFSELVEAGAVHVVGRGSSWRIAAEYGEAERFLSARRGDVRVFRRLETVVSFLRDMGVSRFDVDATGYDPDAGDRPTRPDWSVALKEAHAARAPGLGSAPDPDRGVPRHQRAIASAGCAGFCSGYQCASG